MIVRQLDNKTKPAGCWLCLCSISKQYAAHATEAFNTISDYNEKVIENAQEVYTKIIRLEEDTKSIPEVS